jgi:HAMP domain-containing protein
MAVVLAATGLFVYGRVQSSLDSAVDHSLRSRAADVAALAQQSDTGLSDSRNVGVLGRVQLAQLLDARGRLVDKTPNLAPRPLLDPAQVARARTGVLIVSSARVGADHRVRLLAAPTDAQGQKMVVVVGQSLEERDQALSNLTGVLLLGGPIALVLAALAGFALTGFALRPVESMRRRAQTISATDLDSRLPSAGGNDELGRLGRTLNAMLERIQEAVARERTFVADASHALGDRGDRPADASRRRAAAPVEGRRQQLRARTGQRARGRAGRRGRRARAQEGRAGRARDHRGRSRRAGCRRRSRANRTGARQHARQRDATRV